METIYDISDWEIYNINLLIIFVLWIFAFTITFIISYDSQIDRNVRKTFFSWKVLTINFLFMALTLSHIYNFFYYRSKLINEEVYVIEGSILKYRPQGFFSKKSEIIQIDSITVYYNMNHINHIGFRQTQGLGNNLKQGDSLKVYYVDNHILKLERRHTVN